jgi:Tfp pilus assembly protein PilF
MRTIAVVLLVSVICLAGGFFAGAAACHRSRVASAQAALRRASEAMTAGRRDEVLEYAFAAVDRDPQLYAAYELAADAVVTQRHNELATHFYRAALAGVGTGSVEAPGAGEPGTVAVQRARIRAKIAALGNP